MPGLPELGKCSSLVATSEAGEAHPLGVVAQRYPGPVEHVRGEAADREPARYLRRSVDRHVPASLWMRRENDLRLVDTIADGPRAGG